MRGRRVLAGLIAALAAGPAARAADDPVAACDERFARAPEEYDSSFCYYQAAQDAALRGAAARRLDVLAARHPGNHWLVLTRGHLELQRHPERAEPLYRRAAEGFAGRSQAAGEIAARFNLRTLYQRQGRVEDAGREVSRVLAVAEQSGDARLLAQARTLEALHLTETSRDVGRAYRALRRAEAAAFPDGEYRLRRAILLGLGNVCFGLGRFDEALLHYRRLAALTSDAGDGLNQSIALYNVANTRLRQLEELPEEGGADEVREAAERALAAARAAGNRDTETQALRTLGELPAAGAQRERTRAYLDQCVARARALGQERRTSACLWALGAHLAGEDAGRAEALVDEALRLALHSQDAAAAAFAWRQRMRLSWRTRPFAQALSDSFGALDSIEALRGRQPERAGAARLFSAWSPDYYWLAGRLLLEAENGAAGALGRAFEVVERMRARALLDALDAAGSVDAREAPAGPARERQRAAQEALVALQRRLLDPALQPAARAELLARLERAEDDEADARRAAQGAPGAARTRTPLATLGEVRARLSPDEALLSFQVALWTDVYGAFGGGAWLLLVTRDGARAFRLPDRTRLEPAVSLFLGLVTRRDGAEAAAAARLHADLLAAALASLPAHVRRLVVVPDGALHRLPLAALRDAAGQPLVRRYTTTVVPSASLWLRWRRSGPVRPPPAVLALADPEPAGGAAGPRAGERAWPLSSGAAPGPLPYARREGRAAVEALSGASRLLAGRDATEHALKATALEPFGVLHFAAHALVDDERPERSAILLAPGADDEDGLLQWREIADLSLRGRLVVLSSCRSASGTVLRGEGVLGLVRAFFEAGAPVVVGSLWPVRDDEAADLLSAFYRHLRGGASAAEALRSAQDEAQQRGRPASAWAGPLVLGDGGAAALDVTTDPRVAGTTPLLVLAVLGLALIAYGLHAARAGAGR